MVHSTIYCLVYTIETYMYTSSRLSVYIDGTQKPTATWHIQKNCQNLFFSSCVSTHGMVYIPIHDHDHDNDDDGHNNRGCGHTMIRLKFKKIQTGR